MGQLQPPYIFRDLLKMYEEIIINNIVSNPVVFVVFYAIFQIKKIYSQNIELLQENEQLRTEILFYKNNQK